MDIIAHIKSRGMTVAAVARMAGVTRPTIYELADPASNPTMKTIKAVAKVLDLSPAQIRPDLAE
jgi:DNA-binding phage protein